LLTGTPNKAIEYLDARSLVKMLLGTSLLTFQELIAEPMTVRSVNGRNRNFRALLASGKGFFVKQAGNPLSAATLLNEAKILGSVAPTAAQSGIRMPRLLYYDESRDVLITEHLSGRRMGSGPMPLYDISEKQMTSLGQSLALVHRTNVSKHYADRRIPLGLSLSEPSLTLLRNSSPANLRLIVAIQTDARVRDRFSIARQSWCASTFVHGDLKFQNVISCGNKEKQELVLIDWEFGGIGDPRWDVGSILGEILNLWLTDVVHRELREGEQSRDESCCQSALKHVRELIDALLDSYFQTSNVSFPNRFKEDCFSFSAARLLQTAYESQQLRRELDIYAVRTIQASANIATDVDYCIRAFTGMH
jgi:5-methylthioribose kinase